MDKDYGKIISQNLKRIAYENDRTQADICRDLKLSNSTVSSWFNGSRIPRMSKIDLLAHYFNCTPDAFDTLDFIGFARVGHPNGHPEAENFGSLPSLFICKKPAACNATGPKKGNE